MVRNPKKSNSEYGRELEQYVSNKFIDLGHKYARPSKGSGNKGEAGDVSGQSLVVCECKHYNTKDITIKEDVWKKLNNEIPLHSSRFPVYFLQNGENRRLAVIDIDLFFQLLDSHQIIMEENRCLGI